jgi:hypothetical protein
MHIPKKIGNTILCHFAKWHEWYDVEEEMVEFLVLVVSVGVIH